MYRQSSSSGSSEQSRVEEAGSTWSNFTKEVLEYTEWINSIIIVPLKKPGSSLRLCIDPKDLHKATRSNWWYNRTIDDLLPEPANSKYLSLLHLLWHIPLDKESSLLTTFHTPWGKNHSALATPTFWVNRERWCGSRKTWQSPKECSQYYRYCRWYPVPWQRRNPSQCSCDYLVVGDSKS